MLHSKRIHRQTEPHPPTPPPPIPDLPLQSDAVSIFVQAALFLQRDIPLPLLSLLSRLVQHGPGLAAQFATCGGLDPKLMGVLLAEGAPPEMLPETLQLLAHIARWITQVGFPPLFPAAR